jgi:hypothetical protein
MCNCITMKLFIEKGTLVEEVKKIFTTCYPFLKLELYKKPLTNFLYKKEVISSNLPLIQTKKPGKTIINIEENKTVADLESDFSMIGLKAEIFRKSGNVWVETSLTSNWTLQQQNAEAKEISMHFNDEKVIR